MQNKCWKALSFRVIKLDLWASWCQGRKLYHPSGTGTINPNNVLKDISKLLTYFVTTKITYKEKYFTHVCFLIICECFPIIKYSFFRRARNISKGQREPLIEFNKIPTYQLIIHSNYVINILLMCISILFCSDFTGLS